MKIPAKVALLFVLFATCVFGQMIMPMIGTSTQGSSDGKGNSWGSATFTIPAQLPGTIVGAPFSGEENRESVQLLSDGTRITGQGLLRGSKIWRDSQGRTRTERPLMPGLTRAGKQPDPDKELKIIQIADPGIGEVYILDPDKKVAYRAKVKFMPAPKPQKNPLANLPTFVNAPPGVPEPPKMSSEDLGTRVVEGVVTEGIRRTSVTPVGARGNDRPITEVSESWWSPQLGMVVLQTSKSPSGESSMGIVKLSTLEPSPDLFRVPPGYEVRDVSGSFTVEYGEKPASAQR